jgi:hypothetical protein
MGGWHVCIVAMKARAGDNEGMAELASTGIPSYGTGDVMLKLVARHWTEPAV